MATASFAKERFQNLDQLKPLEFDVYIENVCASGKEQLTAEKCNTSIIAAINIYSTVKKTSKINVK